MSHLIENIIDAYSVKGEQIAARVFSVGAARLDGMTSDDIVVQAQAALEASSDTKRHLDGFSTSTLNNAWTSFGIYTKDAGLTPPKSKKALGEVFGDAARLIEQARVKHGAKSVKAALKEFMVAGYVSDEARADHVAEIMTTLIGLEKQDDDRKKTPEERFIAALKTAENLLESIELSPEQADMVADILANLGEVV